MFEKLKAFIKSEAFWELFRYGIIGVLTTAVSYGTMYVFHYMWNMESNLSNTLSILCAILFAYAANKLFVFKSKTDSFPALLREAASFFAARGFAMLVEIVGYFFFNTILRIEAMIAKLLINIVVLILNYVLSKLFVFRKTK